MKAKISQNMVEHFTLGVTAVAGIIFLALAWKSQDGLAVAVRASYFAYGILFVVGALAYYTRPRIGSAILIVSLLSMPIVAALVGFPVWVNGSAGSRIGLILGAITSAGIVSAPLLKSRDNGQA
jgi:predicted PurR-regulated permease PerM